MRIEKIILNNKDWIIENKDKLTIVKYIINNLNIF